MSIFYLSISAQCVLLLLAAASLALALIYLRQTFFFSLPSTWALVCVIGSMLIPILLVANAKRSSPLLHPWCCCCCQLSSAKESRMSEIWNTNLALARLLLVAHTSIGWWNWLHARVGGGGGICGRQSGGRAASVHARLATTTQTTHTHTHTQPALDLTIYFFTVQIMRLIYWSCQS